MSLKEAEKESTNSGSNDDDETHVTGSMVKSSTTTKLKKFDFITKDGKHIRLTKEQINQQKKIEEEAKAEAAKHEGEVRKAELVDLLGPEVVNKYYNYKLQYDRYCDKMLNRRAESRITNYDVLTKKGPITLKVYRDDGTSEVIPNFKASDLHLELGINLDITLSEQDPLNKLNGLANKKRKHASDIHDYFKANKKLKSSVQYEDHLPGTMLNELVLDVLRDGETCQRCTCTRCGSGLSKGLCYICGNNQNSSNDSPSISANSSQNPPHIDKCCYECGEALDGIFCQQCTCKSCGKGAHIGYNCPSKVSIISNPEPCNQTMNNELPQTLPSFDSTCYSDKENLVPCVSKPNFVDESSNIFNPPPQPPIYSCELCGSNAQYGHYCTPQAPFINPEPGYSQDFNFPQDEVIKSSVKDLVPIPSESKGKNGCDVPSCFTTFSNILFDADYDFESVDDQSLHNEGVSEKIFSNPLFEEEIISIRIDQHYINSESDLVESMLNRDSSVISSSSKIDSLLDEFVGELTLLKSIPSGIDKADCHPKNEIHFFERLLYDNSSPRPPEEFVFENSNAEIESFSPSPIPIKDSDSHMEEINLSFNLDDPMPPSIKDDNNDSEGDNLFLERLLHDDPIPLSDTLDFSNVVRVFLPFFTYSVTFSLLLSSGSEDTIFDPGISNYHFSSFKPKLSHRCGTFKKFNTHRSHLNESLMEILFSIFSPMDQ
uniref:Uncharacterized protein n=1 Tax=Tanacetum cinerariifolium TaxID=118510 RepID=A0A6L2JJR7_TANCI|nr:hypothetical protein [Tanacetum cinerariifolium]